MGRICLLFLTGFFVLVSCQHKNTAPNRDIIPFGWELVFDLSDGSTGILQTRRMQLYKEELLVVDRNDQIIKKIDLWADSVLQQFGNGIGKGPGEHESIIELDATEDFVISIDPILLRITYFDHRTGNVIKTSPMKSTTTWYAHLDRHYVTSASVQDSLFFLYDASTDSLLSSASILNLDAAREYALSLPGRFLVHDDSFLYFPVWDHRVFEFSVQGQNLVRGRIIPTPLDTFTFKPSVDMSDATGDIIQAPKSRYVRTGVTESNGSIFNLVHLFGFHPTQRYETFLDVYDSDLNYRFSYGDLHDQFYPNGIQDISAHGDTICFLSSGNVLCYKINLPD